MNSYEFSVDGPKFKDDEHYLTNEGYPLGTTCYYYILKMCGYIYYCCGDTKMDAIKKTVERINEIAIETEKHERRIQ